MVDDSLGLRSSTGQGMEMIVCSSFSKIFGLYRERVGALTVVAADNNGADTVQSQVKVCIRSNYSNPPAHGAELVVPRTAGVHCDICREVLGLGLAIGLLRPGADCRVRTGDLRFTIPMLYQLS